jgi:hypothetical protein
VNLQAVSISQLNAPYPSYQCTKDPNGTTSPINDFDVENFPRDFDVALAIASCYSKCTTT